MRDIEFWVNDVRVSPGRVSPTTTLLSFLRGQLRATGTKEGCAEGDCGACTVAIADPAAPGGPSFRAVNSCLVLLPMVQGKRVYTVEGLATAGKPHPVQESLVAELGSQCGYCTPGVVMSMFEACYRGDLDEPWKLDDQLCGNLCRCTGYRPIRDATRRIGGLLPDDRFARTLSTLSPAQMDLEYEHGAQKWFTPSSFDALWEVLDRHPDARFVAGGTDLSLEVTKKFVEPPLLVSLEGLSTLRESRTVEGVWTMGSGVDLATLEFESRSFAPAIERMLRFFGSRQIKHRATVGGNLCTASPIGDLAPVLLALDASVALRSRGGRRVIPLDEFFLGYRKTALAPGEILESVQVPLRGGDIRAAAYKVSKRQELDISSVSAGCWISLAEGLVSEARFAFGGMAATPRRARAAEQAAIGRPWSEETAELAALALDRDFTPIDDHRASAWYRRTVARNLIRGFFHETSEGNAVPRLPHRPTGTVLVEVTP